MNKVRSFWRVVFSQVMFFWLTLVVFMAVSVTESGAFFDAAITHGALYGTLGYAVACVFDLLSIVFMLSRINALRLADRKGAWLSLFGVTACAGISAFANTATAVQSYQTGMFNHIPTWMQVAAPYLGCVFPLMIVGVSIIADHITDLNPARHDSVEKYRLREEKKLNLLRVRLEFAREMAELQGQMKALRHKSDEKALHQAQARYDAQLRGLAGEVEALKMLLDPVPGPNTDELKSIPEARKALPKPGRTSKGSNTTALQAVRRAVREQPDVATLELAKRLNISRSYASRLKKRALEELQIVTVQMEQE